MDVTLLGTGDTAGTPVPGCDCGTCRRARELEVERSRFSVHVRSEAGGQAGDVLLVDFSPDFRAQFLRESVPLPDAGVVTHAHYDHLGGLGNCYRLVDDLPVLAADGSDAEATTGEDAAADGSTAADGEPTGTEGGEPTADADTEPSVAERVRSRYDYLDAVTVRPVEPFEPVACCGLQVTFVPVDHPPMPCYGLRIEDPATGGVLALTGDTTYAIPGRSRAALAGADLLVADGIVPASYCDGHPAGGADHDEAGVPRTFGTKHATREGAEALADELDADALRVVHCSHNYPPDEAFEPPLAVDGERFEL